MPDGWDWLVQIKILYITLFTVSLFIILYIPNRNWVIFHYTTIHNIHYITIYSNIHPILHYLKNCWNNYALILCMIIVHIKRCLTGNGLKSNCCAWMYVEFNYMGIPLYIYILCIYLYLKFKINFFLSPMFILYLQLNLKTQCLTLPLFQSITK